MSLVNMPLAPPVGLTHILAKHHPLVGLRDSTSYQINREVARAATSSHSQGVQRTVLSTMATPRADLLEARLFEAKAHAKTIAASLSMHLSGDWRKKIYTQLDELLDISEWQVEDRPLNRDSVRTFLRFVIYAGVTSVPSLGLSNSGNLIAGWHQEKQKLTMEFLAQDKCRVVVADKGGTDPSIITFNGVVAKAREFLIREQFAVA